MQLGLSWNKFPQTNSPPDHQPKRTNEELIVKSLGQTTQSFLCQVSMTRGWSHPLLAPHPWLPERYFSGFNHETCFLSPLQSSTQRGLIKITQQMENIYFVPVLRNMIHQKWAVKSFYFQGQCPHIPGCLWTWNQTYPSRRQVTAIQMSSRVMPSHGLNAPSAESDCLGFSPATLSTSCGKKKKNWASCLTIP